MPVRCRRLQQHPLSPNQQPQTTATAQCCCAATPEVQLRTRAHWRRAENTLTYPNSVVVWRPMLCKTRVAADSWPAIGRCDAAGVLKGSRALGRYMQRADIVCGWQCAAAGFHRDRDRGVVCSDEIPTGLATAGQAGYCGGRKGSRGTCGRGWGAGGGVGAEFCLRGWGVWNPKVQKFVYQI